MPFAKALASKTVEVIGNSSDSLWYLTLHPFYKIVFFGGRILPNQFAKL